MTGLAVLYLFGARLQRLQAPPPTAQLRQLPIVRRYLYLAANTKFFLHFTKQLNTVIDSKNHRDHCFARAPVLALRTYTTRAWYTVQRVLQVAMGMTFDLTCITEEKENVGARAVKKEERKSMP